MHGVGLCDEWPLIAYPSNFVEGAYDYPLEAGMVLCVEALVSPEGGDFSIKLEDQVLITEDGYENLTKYPFDPVLMGQANPARSAGSFPWPNPISLWRVRHGDFAG